MSATFSFLDGQSLEYYQNKRKEFLKRKIECSNGDNCPVCANAKRDFLWHVDEMIKNFASLV